MRGIGRFLALLMMAAYGPAMADEQKRQEFHNYATGRSVQLIDQMIYRPLQDLPKGQGVLHWRVLPKVASMGDQDSHLDAQALLIELLLQALSPTAGQIEHRTELPSDPRGHWLNVVGSRSLFAIADDHTRQFFQADEQVLRHARRLDQGCEIVIYHSLSGEILTALSAITVSADDQANQTCIEDVIFEGFGIKQPLEAASAKIQEREPGALDPTVKDNFETSRLLNHFWLLAMLQDRCVVQALNARYLQSPEPQCSISQRSLNMIFIVGSCSLSGIEPKNFAIAIRNQDCVQDEGKLFELMAEQQDVWRVEPLPYLHDFWKWLTGET